MIDGASPLRAMGDPQAPFATVKAVLGHQGMLEGDRICGRLLSIGDHFDWGHVVDREVAARDGEALLRWLASHDAEQVIILCGNHDLARVGELNNLDDQRFAALQALADAHYHRPVDDDSTVEHSGAARARVIDELDHDEMEFFRACSWLPSTEIVARDLSTYRHSQHLLVKQLLVERRMRLAHADNGLLFTHAAITRKALTRLGVDDETVAGSSGADIVAAALNRALDEAVARHLVHPTTTPLVIPGLHKPADGISEGDGVLYHRPTFVHKDQWLEPRRYDPRRLPHGLWQVCGHVRDKRCISSLKGWSAVREHQVGVVRHLIAWHDADNTVVYRHGLPPPRSEVGDDASVVIFIDGAMAECPPERYQLLDVDAVA